MQSPWPITQLLQLAKTGMGMEYTTYFQLLVQDGVWSSHIFFYLIYMHTEPTFMLVQWHNVQPI